MKECTEWDLSPIKAKLDNTAPFFDCARLENTFLRRSHFYRDLSQYIRFGLGDMKLNSKMHLLDTKNWMFPVDLGIPINGTEYVMFADAKNQIAVDFVNKSDCLPGTQKLKPNMRAKSKALEDCGWKHIYYHEEHMMDMNAQDKIN